MDNKNDNECRITDFGKETIIFLDKMDVDMETMKQIRHMIKNPCVNDLKIMPDANRGVGCCVGSTFRLADKIVPAFIGADIGCGIITYNTGKDLTKVSLKKMNKLILEVIPMGSGKDGVYKQPVVTDEELLQLYIDARESAELFSKKYAEKYNVDISSYIPEYSDEWFTNKCLSLGTDRKVILITLGSLGMGNHYIECNENERIGETYITIHSGSRTIGEKICQYHQTKISDNNKFDWAEFNDEAKHINRSFGDKKERKKAIDALREKLEAQKHPDYLEGEEMYQYFFDMIFAQKFAQLNRRIMLRRILEAFNINFQPDKIIESIHNYIDFNDFIVRKGAISAHKDEMCIVSLNMRDGILLCKGKGNEKWNYSSAHGSGRILTREQAKRKLSMKKFEQEMSDVYSTCVCPATLDEAPMAYKDSEFIKEMLGSTIEIIEQLKPILNVKGLN